MTLSSREPLLALLADYEPADENERESQRRILRFVRSHPDCFERTLAIGHVTGSAWIVDPSCTRCLLTHHRKLGRWLQLGGHADGDGDVLAVAMREAREESGLRSLRAVSGAVFDCDAHAIPARGSEREHVHYDVRFLLEADPDEPLVVSEESHELAWVRADGLDRLDVDESVARMAKKALQRRS